MSSKRYKSYIKISNNPESKLNKKNLFHSTAFTLVEIAISLIVGAIILAIAIKGKVTIESSRITSDITKIKNMIYAAVSGTDFEKDQMINYPISGQQPKVTQYINHNQLFEDNGLYKNDVTLYYFNDIAMLQCRISDSYYAEYNREQPYDIVQDVCLLLRNKNNDILSITPLTTCILDTRLDDGNTADGSIRLWESLRSDAQDFSCPNDSIANYPFKEGGVAIGIYSFLL